MKDRSMAIFSYGAASCLSVVEGRFIKLFFCSWGILHGGFDSAQPPASLHQLLFALYPADRADLRRLVQKHAST
jgi:hypothetical protein